jgi:hypothetical protein
MWFGDMFTMPGWECVAPATVLKISLGGVGGCSLAEALRSFGQPSYPYDWLITTQSFVEKSFNDMQAFFEFAEEFVYDNTKLLTRSHDAIMLHDFNSFLSQQADVAARYTRRFARFDAALHGPHPILFVRVADNLEVPLSPRKYYDDIFVREAEDVSRWNALMETVSARYKKCCKLLYVLAKNSKVKSAQYVLVRELDDPKDTKALQALIAEVAEVAGRF